MFWRRGHCAGGVGGVGALWGGWCGAARVQSGGGAKGPRSCDKAGSKLAVTDIAGRPYWTGHAVHAAAPGLALRLLLRLVDITSAGLPLAHQTPLSCHITACMRRRHAARRHLVPREAAQPVRRPHICRGLPAHGWVVGSGCGQWVWWVGGRVEVYQLPGGRVGGGWVGACLVEAGGHSGGISRVCTHEPCGAPKRESKLCLKVRRPCDF